MKRLLTFVAIVSSIGSLIAQTATSRHVSILDLTGSDVVKTFGPIATEGGVTGARPQTLGLEVRLVSMSRNAFRLGDRFVFEIEVMNAGNAPIDFPRSVDLSSFVPGNPSNSIARIYLQTRGRHHREVLFGATTLAGSDELPGSLQRLGPGDTMLIRLPAGVSLDGDQHDDLIESSAKAAVPVNAVVAFDTSNDTVRWVPTVSKNSLPLVIRP